MTSRRVLAVAVVCLLAVAGCTATAGPETPPGISETEVTDTTALVAAHTEALRSTSFTVRTTRTMQSTEPAFTVTRNQTWHMDPAEGPRGLMSRTVTVTGNAPERYRRAPDRVSAWRDGSTTVERTERNGTVSTQRVDLLNSSVRLNPALQRQRLYELTRRSGATIERVSGSDPPAYRISAQLNDTGVTSNASMTVLVGADGIVREIRTARTVRYRSGPRRITERIRISDVGTTTVERPTWANTANETTTQ